MDSYRDNELEWLPYDRNYIQDHVPNERGLYSLSSPKGSVIYVGKADGAGSGVRTRLLTYGTGRCHNRWIRLYFSFGEVAWTYGLKPRRRRTLAKPRARHSTAMAGDGAEWLGAQSPGASAL